MLVLFNGTVMPLDNPQAAVDAAQLSLGRWSPSDIPVAQVQALFQAAVFRNPKLAKQQTELLKGLLGLIHLRSGANAALALMRQGGKSEADVFVRFRTVDETVMAHLNRLQSRATLNFAAVDVAVWSKPG